MALGICKVFTLSLAALIGQASIAQSSNEPPPTLIQANPSSLLGIEPIGTPTVRTLLGYTRRVLHLHDGHTMAVFSFSGSTAANWVFLIDSRDLSVKRFAIPNDDIGSHGAALAAEGEICIMPYGNSRAHIFDAKSESFESIESELPATEYTWDAIGAANGKIYFGTYPNSYFGEFDPKTKTFHLIRQAVPGKKYTTSFSETAEGEIRFKGWGPGETWMRFDPETRKLSEELQAETNQVDREKEDAATPWPSPNHPEGVEKFASRIEIGGRWFAIGFPSSRFYEISEDGRAIERGDPEAPAEVWFLEESEGCAIGISHFGRVFRYDPETEEFDSNQIDNHAPGGNGIMFIEALSPECVIGANYSQQNLWKINPETGEIIDSESMIARVTGEPMCAIAHDGRGYLGIYVNSLISVFDPEHPFQFGENPRELIALGETYKQTRPRDTATDGETVFITSDSAYGHLGGALVEVDPETNKTAVHYPLIEDQNLPTIAYDPESRLLWGGTDRWGQMRSHPPTQESSLIYAFDPSEGTVVRTLSPWPGADVTQVLGVLPGGILVASASGELATIDTATTEILFKGPVDFPIPKEIRIGADGEAYCLTGGAFCRWDPVNHQLEPLVKIEGCKYFTEARPGDWVFGNSTTVFRTIQKR